LRRICGEYIDWPWKKNNKIPRIEGHTIDVKLRIQIISDLHIDDTQGDLILFVVALIEDLDRDNGRILDRTERWA
jgi:hypothetical protein